MIKVKWTDASENERRGWLHSFVYTPDGLFGVVVNEYSMFETVRSFDLREVPKGKK